MAVTEIKESTSIKLTYVVGRDNETKLPIKRSKTYSSVKVDALSQDIYDVGTTIASLQDFPLISVKKVEETIIAE